jgi:hypothetical protein
MTLLERLAQHLQRPVNEDVRTRARLHLLDWLACVAGARGWATENGFRDKWTWDDLCVLAGNVLEMDDVHRGALLHPGPVVWGVAIGRNAPRDIPMYGILDGAVVGYEAMIALVPHSTHTTTAIITRPRRRAASARSRRGRTTGLTIYDWPTLLRWRRRLPAACGKPDIALIMASNGMC